MKDKSDVPGFFLNQNLEGVVFGLTRVHDHGFSEDFCRFNVPPETVFLPGKIALTPVVIKPCFTHSLHFGLRADMKDALKAHFGTLGGYLKLRVQRPGAVKVPGIATHELNHPVNLAFFAGNHHPARQMRGFHAFDHLVTVSIKLRGIDVRVRIKKFNCHLAAAWCPE